MRISARALGRILKFQLRPRPLYRPQWPPYQGEAAPQMDCPLSIQNGGPTVRLQPLSKSGTMVEQSASSQASSAEGNNDRAQPRRYNIYNPYFR